MPDIDRRVEQVGADRRCRVDAEEQHQQRGHERSTANASQADNRTDNKSRKGVKPIHDAPQ